MEVLHLHYFPVSYAGLDFVLVLLGLGVISFLILWDFAWWHRFHRHGPVSNPPVLEVLVACHLALVLDAFLVLLSL